MTRDEGFGRKRQVTRFSGMVKARRKVWLAAAAAEVQTRLRSVSSTYKFTEQAQRQA